MHAAMHRATEANPSRPDTQIDIFKIANRILLVETTQATDDLSPHHQGGPGDERHAAHVVQSGRQPAALCRVAREAPVGGFGNRFQLHAYVLD